MGDIVVGVDGSAGSLEALRFALGEAPAAEALITVSSGADLLVVGSRGRGGFTGLLLGSVSQHCAQHAACPVVIVPSRVEGRADAAPHSAAERT